LVKTQNDSGVPLICRALLSGKIYTTRYQVSLLFFDQPFKYMKHGWAKRNIF
ncbi:MAG: hypothetical protein RIR44_431, partial [Bacteroidota bacterium]